MARLIFKLGDGKTLDFNLSAAVVTLGRATSNDIVINNSWISSHHAKFERSGGTVEVMSLGTLHGIPLKEYKRVGGVYTVVDLNSHNGLTVNGKRVTSKELKSGDVLSFGQLEALFRGFGNGFAVPRPLTTHAASTAPPGPAPGPLHWPPTPSRSPSGW
jgi:pSer/pThr/pTyr-binding forkhead associated (FHA) protein